MKQVQEWKDLLAELSPPVADASTPANFLFTEQVRGDHFVDSKVNLLQLTIPGLVGFGRAKLRTLLETKISSSQSASSSIEDVTISADSLREVKSIVDEKLACAELQPLHGVFAVARFATSTPADRSAAGIGASLHQSRSVRSRTRLW